MSDALVILLHGVGSRGADLLGLADAWRPWLPDARFAGSDAPQLFDHGGLGRQWFSVTGVTDANRPSRILAARPAFDQAIGDILAETGFAGRLDQVALVGFSQGSITALDAVVSGRWPVRAVVAFSGRLASPAPFTPATHAPVLLVHGTADPVMPVALCREAHNLLTGSGFDVTRHELPGVGHQITPDGIALSGRFLADVLGCR